MIVTVNGEPVTCDEGVTVADLLRDQAPGAAGRGVAVAVDGEVVPRSQWQAQQVTPGQHVQVLVAVQGG